MTSTGLERLILDLRSADAAGVALADYPLSEEELSAQGFVVAEPGRVRLPADAELLDADIILAGLSPPTRDWHRDLQVLPVVGSTNNLLLERAASGPIDGQVVTAEYQTAGRGRRGRVWHSPIAANLAISLGFTLDLPLSRLGGLSLAVGLGLIDAFDPSGELGLAVKWPNDLVHAQGKLAGVLVELAQWEGKAQVIIGIGVNWRIAASTRAQIEQPVADMRGLAPDVDRNRGAVRLIDEIVKYVGYFADAGFEAMQTAYDRHHLLHLKECLIHGPDGPVEARVEGVAPDGALRARVAGNVREYTSGEVSIRAR